MLAHEHVGDVLGNPDLQNLGDRPGALRAYRQAAGVGKRLYELDRSDQRAASDYGIVLSHVETAMDDNDFLQKLAVQRESLRVLDEAVRNSPDNVTPQIYRALVHLHLGDTLTAAGKVEDARLAYLDSAAITAPSLKLGHAPQLVLFIRSNQRLALNAVTRARRADALMFAERALHTRESPSADAPSVRAGPRGCSAMGLTYAALLRSPVRQPGDREDALSWLRKAADAWHAAQSDSALEAPDRREMREVEEALSRIERR
jgi:tetratricopeptide (TPR) repeat protein